MQALPAILGIRSRIYKKNLSIAFLTYERGKMRWQFAPIVQFSETLLRTKTDSEIEQNYYLSNNKLA